MKSSKIYKIGVDRFTSSSFVNLILPWLWVKERRQVEDVDSSFDNSYRTKWVSAPFSKKKTDCMIYIVVEL